MNRNNRRQRGRREVPPMTVFDLVAQEHLGGEAGKAASRLFHEGELDDVSTRNVLSSLGCTEGNR